MKTLIALTLISLLLPAVGASADFTNGESVRRLFDNLDRTRLNENIAKDHPDFAILTAARALRADVDGDPKAVTTLAESIFLQQKFEGVSRVQSNGTADLYVGNVGSFPVWRELLYLEAGRAYYKQGELDRAEMFLRAVPDTSPFAVIARLELGWAFLKQRDVAQANENLGKIGSFADRMDGLQHNEFLLQHAYYSLEVGDPAQAATLAEQAHLRPDATAELRSMRSKIIAQSRLSQYLLAVNTTPFQEKKALLDQILREVEGIPARYRDPEFSSLAGETYWHLASLLRIEDPDKYHEQSSAALRRANEWLAPWIDRSLAQKKALFSEDAFFLSVAVLWEQRKYEAAIPRLMAMPAFFPKGEFLQDTYQLLADYYFDAGEFGKALKYYTQLARVGNTEKAAYGVYKAAWTFYNQEEKWKALRHLERLLIHYKDDLAKTDPTAPQTMTLLKESENDMLLIMAELLPFRQALQELRIFEFPEDKRIATEERLGTVYKEIGRYEDSIAVLQTLLADSSKTKVGADRVYHWLGQMLVAQLSSGRRGQIATSLDRFLPILPQPSSDEGQKLRDEMEKQIVAITLTVHREAKKTDDEDIWNATDAIYRSVAAHYPDCKDPDLWYYGAQRKEQLGAKRDAMNWYRKAASNEKYTNRADAALESLRLARDIGNEKTAGAKTNYAELSDVASWYLQTFPKAKERGLAEFMVLEFSDKVKDWKKSHDAVLAFFQTDGFTQDHQDQYLAHNKRLYEAAAWDESYRLANDISKMIPQDAKFEVQTLHTKLVGFQQETAFQAAFAAEKPQKGQPKPTAEGRDVARLWYERAIMTPADPAVTLKAWHNLLMSYALPAEGEKMLERFRVFETSYSSPKGMSKERLALVLSVYARAADAWEAIGQPVRRAETLSRGAQFQGDPAKYVAMHWEALTTFGTYYQMSHMKSEIDILRREHPQTINDSKNQMTIARLYFWNANYTDAWNMARAMADAKDPPAQTWVLISDLFSYTQKMKNIGQGSIYSSIREYLLGHGKQIAGIGILQPILVDVLYPQLNIAKLGTLEELDREPAGAEQAKTPGAELKARVESIARILKALDRQQAVLKSYTQSPAAQIAVAGLCAAPILKRAVVAKLGQFREHPIASKQWNDFVARVGTKMNELSDIARQEQTSCDQQKKTIAYMKPSQEIISPLCGEYSCYPTVPSKMEDILALEEERRKNPSTKLDDVRRYLSIGAWAPAEVMAYSSNSPKERALLLAYIRVAMGDTWNAAPLLKDATTDSAQAPHAYLLLAAIAWRHGAFGVAADQLNHIRGQPQFLGWEEKIYDEVKSSIPDHSTAAVGNTRDLGFFRGFENLAEGSARDCRVERD
jgi:tetratricopeptide (TPR) repeat protein